MALVQNNHCAGGPHSLGFLVWVRQIDSLLFQGNHCLGPVVPSFFAPVLVLATRANVVGNLVDVVGSRAMEITGADLVVSANSVRSGEQSLAVSGSPVGPGPVRVIVTSNLTTGIVATSTGVLLRASNFPAP